MALPKSNASLFSTLPPPPAGHVWVEWVGEPSPRDNPAIELGLALKRFTRDQEQMIRRLCRARIARVHGHRRTLRRGNGAREIPTLSQDWSWGNHDRARPGHPRSYCQALPFRDADAIKSSAVGHEFIIHDERDGGAVDLIVGATGDVRLVAAGAFGDGTSFRRAMGW